jgi:hypothetical protein
MQKSRQYAGNVVDQRRVGNAQHRHKSMLGNAREQSTQRVTGGRGPHDLALGLSEAASAGERKAARIISIGQSLYKVSSTSSMLFYLILSQKSKLQKWKAIWQIATGE